MRTNLYAARDWTEKVSMSNQPPQPLQSAMLLEKIGTLQHNWNEIDGFLKQLLPALSKKGFKLSVDVDSLIRNTAHSLADTSQQAHNMVEQLKQLQELIQQSAELTSSLELDQVLERVMDSVTAITGAQRAYLMLRDASTGNLTVRTARNWDREQLEKEAVAYSKSVVDAAIKQAAPVITSNAQLDERFQTSASVADMSLRMILCIPLMLRGHVVGVLYADSKVERGIFREDMVPLLSAFATQAAIAINNASEFGQVKENLAQALLEVKELRIRIDYDRMAHDVSEITESEYFKQLIEKVSELRARMHKTD